MFSVCSSWKSRAEHHLQSQMGTGHARAETLAAARRVADAHAPAQSPCVLLLGWQGCRLKHLSKYATALWEPLGFRCELFVDHSFAMPGMCSSKMLQKLTSLLEQHAPVCVHVFSNGGGLLWRQLIVESRSLPGLALSISAVSHVVYDSTPGDLFPFSPLHLPRSFRYGFQFCWEFFRSPLARCCVVLSAPLMATLTLVLWLVGLQFIKRFNVTEKYHNDLVEGMQRCGYRNLFLYSKDDKLIDYRAVMRIIKQAHDAGADVTAESWAVSTHVRHFQQHEKDYIDACQNFVRHVQTDAQTCT